LSSPIPSSVPSFFILFQHIISRHREGHTTIVQLAYGQVLTCSLLLPTTGLQVFLQQTNNGHKFTPKSCQVHNDGAGGGLPMHSGTHACAESLSSTISRNNKPQLPQHPQSHRCTQSHPQSHRVHTITPTISQVHTITPTITPIITQVHTTPQHASTFRAYLHPPPSPSQRDPLRIFIKIR